MKKYRTKSYANGGTNGGGKKVTVAGATVTAPKGGGIKTQTYGTKDYTKRRDELMAMEVSGLTKGKPKGYAISETERKMAQDRVREKLTKEGVRQVAPGFKDTGKRLTPEEERLYRSRMGK